MATTARSLEQELEPGLPEGRFINRELSALDFNERVLALAEEVDAPLLERVKYAAIFASNMDEFYQVRVATLRRQQLAAPGLLSIDGLDPGTQLERVAERTSVLAVAARQALHP